MNQKIRQIVIFPILAAAPLVLASLKPRQFFADPRCVSVLVFIWGALVLENSIFDPGAAVESQADSQKRRDRKSFELAAVTNIACFYLPIYEYFNLPQTISRGTAMTVLGFILMAGGEGLRVSALRTLGRFFTVRVAVLSGHKVVRDGLYRYVRHPAYTGWFLSSLGVGVYLGSVIGIVGTALFVVVIGWRVKVEEAALCEGLGEEYRRFMREVPRRFIPGIF